MKTTNEQVQNDCAERLRQKIERREAHLAVVGLGYVGLPLAVEMARSGFKVTGIDCIAERVAHLNEGRSHVGDVPDKILAEVIHAGRLSATTDYSILRSVDAVSICVPTPLGKTRDPDISFIINVTEQICSFLPRGLLVVLESTTYPGTTTEVILPRLTRDGWRVGHDFFLAFSPERVDPGNAQFQTHNTPKIVGGVTPTCTELAALLYQQFIQHIHPVSSTEAAEMVKLLENTFRSVNIGLVNEVAIMCNKLGLNVWEIIAAAATKPFGFMPFYPGPGLGGHCIPIDPLYLSWKLKTLNYQARFIELADDINSHMPQFVVTKLNDALNDRSKCLKGSKILVLGIAYKPNVSDVRESPALDILRILREKGSEVHFHDPFIARIELAGNTIESTPLDDQLLSRSDAVIIVTNHANLPYARIVELAPLVIDTRNACRSISTGQDKIVKL